MFWEYTSFSEYIKPQEFLAIWRRYYAIVIAFGCFYNTVADTSFFRPISQIYILKLNILSPSF